MIDCNKLLDRLQAGAGDNPSWYTRAHVVYFGRGKIPTLAARALLVGHGTREWAEWVNSHITVLSEDPEDRLNQLTKRVEHLERLLGVKL